MNGEESVTLWSIHDENSYLKFGRQKIISAKWKYCDEDFIPSYSWMVLQMSLRLEMQISSPPIWGWYRYSERSTKPDLRCSCHLPKGTLGVMLTLKVPAERVLLSQFEMWHCVLNKTYLHLDEKSFNNNEQPGPEEVLSSWNQIFDLKAGCEKYWGKLEERSIQGCVPFVHPDEIVREKKFVAR